MVERTTIAIADGFNEPAGDQTKTRCFLIHDKSFEEHLNDFAVTGDRIIRARNLKGHIAIEGYRTTSGHPLPVAKLILVAYPSDSVPGDFSSNTAYTPEGCTGFRINSILAEFKMSAMVFDNFATPVTRIRMDAMFNYRIPRKTRGVLASDEHLPEPQMRTQLAIWILTPSTGYGFDPEDPIGVVGNVDIQYTSQQRTASLAELV